MEVKDIFLDSLQSWGDANDLDLNIHDYRTAIAETARRNLNRRTRDFINGFNGIPAFSPPQTSYSSTTSPTILSTTASSHSRGCRASSQSSLPVSLRESLLATDGGVLYQPCPANIPKLQTFWRESRISDEPLDFGFPASKDNEKAAPSRPDAEAKQRPALHIKTNKSKDRFHLAQEKFPFLKEDFAAFVASGQYPGAESRPKTSPHLFRESCATFFLDDTPSLYLIDSEDQYMSESNFSPITPKDAAMPVTRESPRRSPQRTSFGLSRPTTGRTNTHYSTISNDREPTMRITLTRPDLRGPEDIDSLYSPSGKFKDLDLPDLSSTDEPGSVWGELPLEEGQSKMKKIFKRFKIR